jgi:EAL domain-containing protein (putative c-di-GMP-specific phosphodiesterase class I)
MEDVELNIEKFEAIKKMGVGIAIDDFGTGYSSLSYLARLPTNALKIDRSFIKTMMTSAESRTIISMTINLAHSLNVKVVAEGVELEAQADLLESLNCDEAQGYLFSPPVPMERIETFLEKTAIRRREEIT